MIDRPLTEDAIFRIALGIESADLREEYLKQACQGDQLLYDRVIVLLDAHGVEPDFLESLPTGVAGILDMAATAEGPGSHIGPYELVAEIGQGGVGVVYLARQHEPVCREVAIKIVKPGLGTREVIARFQAEEQTLAMMDHPNIATVHDAGTTESGRPYFAMERVQGEPITKHCDDHHLTPRERLDLFLPVCRAIQHAHQKGIIHRDIKPSNILVAMQDDQTVPKVIDFGIAKAFNGPAGAADVTTLHGNLIGTPLYMSPEQAAEKNTDVDTRSDVYSLGVLLYELLTGTTPAEREQMENAGPDELRQLICEQEPPRPSTRISTLGQAAVTISERRCTNVDTLRKTLSRELDWIVMKALDKDRARRYESASDFAKDIQRYLNEEPVEACLPTASYRLTKFIRRHKTATLATAAIFLTLILGATIATGQAYRASKAEKSANKQLKVAREQKRLAKQQAQLAREQKKLADAAAKREATLRREAEAVSDFLVDIFRSPDPERDGQEITVAEMLDTAKTRVEEDFEEDAVLQSKLLQAIGETYHGLGLYGKAIPLLENASDLLRKALGQTHPDTLDCWEKLGHSYCSVDRVAEALKIYETSAELHREALGPNHPETLGDMVGVARCWREMGRSNKALHLLEQVMELAQGTLPADDELSLSMMNNLAVCYCDVGQQAKALPLYEQCLEQSKIAKGIDHPNTCAYMENVASIYTDVGRVTVALEMRERLMKLNEERMGSQHPQTLRSMMNLGCLYPHVGRMEDGITLCKKSLDGWKSTIGDKHAETIASTGRLAHLYAMSGEIDESLKLFEEALDLLKESVTPHVQVMIEIGEMAKYAGQPDVTRPILERTLTLATDGLGPDHPGTYRIISLLAGVYADNGLGRELTTLYEQTIEGRDAKQDSNRYDYWNCLDALAQAFVDAGQLEKAVPLFEQTLEEQRAMLDALDPQLLRTREHLANAYGKAERLADAARALEQIIQIAKPKYGPHHRNILITMRDLADVYFRMGRQEEALNLATQTFEQMKTHLGDGHDLPELLAFRLAEYHLEAKQVDAAIKLRKWVVQVRGKKRGPHHRATLWSTDLLCDLYVQEGRYAEAETLLSEMVKVDPPISFRWWRLAVMRLHSDSQEGFRRDCHELIDRYLASDEPSFAGWELAWCCRCAPIRDEDTQRVLHLAEKSLAADPDNVRAQQEFAFALCRAGKLTESLERLQPMWDDDPEGRLWVGIWLAMTHARLGQHEEARKCLDSAIEACQADDYWDTHLDPYFEIEHEILRREAEAVLAECSGDIPIRKANGNKEMDKR